MNFEMSGQAFQVKGTLNGEEVTWVVQGWVWDEGQVVPIVLHEGRMVAVHEIPNLGMAWKIQYPPADFGRLGQWAVVDG